MRPGCVGFGQDSDFRRYVLYLRRLWAASGQNALESSRVLVINGTATSTSTLKNLVLPGIGHFTILDPSKVTPADAGNNFFLNGPNSIGKSRAEEEVRLLLELNDGVEGMADTRSLDEVLDTDPEWIAGFTVVIAHNLDSKLLDRLATFLWSDDSHPCLFVIRSSGFLAEFYIQYHEHASECTHSSSHWFGCFKDPQSLNPTRKARLRFVLIKPFLAFSNMRSRWILGPWIQRSILISLTLSYLSKP